MMVQFTIGVHWGFWKPEMSDVVRPKLENWNLLRTYGTLIIIIIVVVVVVVERNILLLF